ncbi:MAG: siderophore-interacting protein [Pseudomonadota bacterium]
MAKAVRRVRVAEKQSLTPNMTRLHITGESLSDFPTGFDGGYVKFLFESEAEKTVRSFTIRHFDAQAPRLTIDMVAHGDAGPAARWASQVSAGDSIDMMGPGAVKPVNLDADWFILAGDMSALPAICVNLERLPPDARGHVVLEVIDEADQLPLELPEGVQVHWVVNPDPERANSLLEDAVMALPWQDGQVAVWVAGEFSASRALRQYFRHKRQLNRDFLYISCYWKIGVTDEGMKAAKRADTEAW